MGVLEYNCKTKKTEYRDLTEAEIKEYESLAKLETIPQMLTDVEKIEALEKELAELKEALKHDYS